MGDSCWSEWDDLNIACMNCVWGFNERTRVLNCKHPRVEERNETSTMDFTCLLRGLETLVIRLYNKVCLGSSF